MPAGDASVCGWRRPGGSPARGGIREIARDPGGISRGATVTMANASGREGRPVHRGTVLSWLSNVFALNPAGLNWARGVMVLDVALVPPVVFWAIGHEVYLLSALFGALFSVVAWCGDSVRAPPQAAAFHPGLVRPAQPEPARPRVLAGRAHR